MFGSGMLSTLVMLLIVSVIARESRRFLLAVALLVAAGLSPLWKTLCLTGVEYRRSFSQRQVPHREEIQLEIEVDNRKLLSRSWLEIEDEIPTGSPAGKGPHLLLPQAGSGASGHSPSAAAIRAGQAPIHHTLPGRREHFFGPAWLRSGDRFGFVSSDRTQELADSIVVLPRVVPLTELGLLARQPLGDLRAQSWIFENPRRCWRQGVSAG